MHNELSDVSLDELLYAFPDILMRPGTELSEQDHKDIAAIDAVIFQRQKVARA